MCLVYPVDNIFCRPADIDTDDVVGHIILDLFLVHHYCFSERGLKDIGKKGICFNYPMAIPDFYGIDLLFHRSSGIVFFKSDLPAIFRYVGSFTQRKRNSLCRMDDDLIRRN